MAEQERILIVDDEELLALAIRESLQAFDDYYVKIVNKGEDAVELLRESPFDLVMSDVKLPGMNGLD